MVLHHTKFAATGLRGEELPDAFDELFELEWFRYIVSRSLFLGTHGSSEVVECCQEYKGDMLRLLVAPNQLEKIEPVDSGKFNVGKDQVGRSFLQEPESILSAFDRNYIVPFFPQYQADRREEFILIFNKQYCFSPGHRMVIPEVDDNKLFLCTPKYSALSAECQDGGESQQERTIRPVYDASPAWR